MLTIDGRNLVISQSRVSKAGRRYTKDVRITLPTRGTKMTDNAHDELVAIAREAMTPIGYMLQYDRTSLTASEINSLSELVRRINAALAKARAST